MPEDNTTSEKKSFQNQYLHEVAITAIIVKDGPPSSAAADSGRVNKYLIARRSATKKRFPGMWTVPGGKLETKDYLELPKDTEFYWYNAWKGCCAGK